MAGVRATATSEKSCTQSTQAAQPTAAWRRTTVQQTHASFHGASAAEQGRSKGAVDTPRCTCTPRLSVGLLRPCPPSRLLHRPPGTSSVAMERRGNKTRAAVSVGQQEIGPRLHSCPPHLAPLALHRVWRAKRRRRKSGHACHKAKSPQFRSPADGGHGRATAPHICVSQTTADCELHLHVVSEHEWAAGGTKG